MFKNKNVSIVFVFLLIVLGYFIYPKLQPLVETPVIPNSIDKNVITYNNTSADNIVVDLPFPGAVTGKEFKVLGKAKGFFFEGSFPVEVLDKDGKRLFITPATAKGEWMTAEFVPFEADIKIPETYIGPATLILHKDNPSDMRNLDASISFPITIEY